MSDDNTFAADKQINDDFAANVTQKLRDKVVSEACPFCRNLNWYLMDRVGTTSTLGFSGDQTAATYTFACTHCGFVRQHIRLVVDGKIAGEAFYGSK